MFYKTMQPQSVKVLISKLLTGVAKKIDKKIKKLFCNLVEKPIETNGSTLCLQFIKINV